MKHVRTFEHSCLRTLTLARRWVLVHFFSENLFLLFATTRNTYIYSYMWLACIGRVLRAPSSTSQPQPVFILLFARARNILQQMRTAHSGGI